MSVKVHLKGTGEVVEGSVFAVDPVTNTMVMEWGQNYRIIMNSQIVKIEGEITEACAPGVPPSLVRDQKEEKNLRDAEKRLNDINMNVSQEAQSIFDDINFVFESEWHGDRIIINKNYAIEPPYKEVRCINNKGTSEDKRFMARLVKALQAARKKI